MTCIRYRDKWFTPWWTALVTLLVLTSFYQAICQVVWYVVSLQRTKLHRGGERYISVKVIEVCEGDRVEAFAMYAKTDTGIDTDTDIDTETEKETRCRDAVQSDQNRHVQTSCTIQICDP